MKLSVSRLLALAGITFSSFPAIAEIRLPSVITDHAVLQRDRPVHLWGWATPDAHLAAHFHDQTIPAVADSSGKWSLYLKPESAGGPYTLTFSGDGADKVVSDLLMGDVWVASGQSNMEMPLRGFPPGAFIKDSEREIAAATQPKLRLLLVDRKASSVPLSDIKGMWTQCTPETAATFSAVAYFFGREIAQRENVAIGLIDSTWGGTPADAWTSMNTLGSDARLLPAFSSRAEFADKYLDIQNTLDAEKRDDDVAVAAGKPKPSHPWHPFEGSWSPAGLYNGMIAPLTPLTVKGFLWYQGESNSGHDRAPFYDTLFAAMIGDWRMHFAQGPLPFLYVQISSFQSTGEDWGLLREQQRRVLAVTNTAMAVTLDVGTPGNVHPPDKQTVGARLALAARAMVYGEHVAYEGPTFREATLELQSAGVTALRVWFEHGEGLTFRGKAASGFEVAGDDHHFSAAEAKVEGQTVVLRSPSVARPVYVRYGWMSSVADNLYNDAGLPASTFSSEGRAAAVRGVRRDMSRGLKPRIQFL